jgi:hypothetical protein
MRLRWALRICLSVAVALSLDPARARAQLKPTFSIFDGSVDLYVQRTCSDSPNGASFAGTIAAVNRAPSGGQSSLFYTFDGSGMKTGYESASAINTLNVADANAGFAANGLPNGATRFRFVSLSAACSGESLYVWPGSAQSVLDPETSLYAYPFSEAVEEPL